MTPTPIRSVRISTELWRKAGEKATKEGKSISQVIVEALTKYTN